MEAFDRIKKLVAEVDEDVAKCAGGNRAAGTRVRQVMQEIKNAAQEVRQAVLDQRKKEETPG